jgi:hypothetical protein
MSARLISNPRYALLAGLITVGGLVTVISQRSPDFEGTTIATQNGSQETTKFVSVHAAKNNVSSIGNPSDNGKNLASVDGDNALWSVSLASLTATGERPIFSPTRRPPPALVKSAPAQAPSAVQPLLALIGAIASEDEGIGIFLDGTTKAIIRMKTGESHAGWTLQAVKAREVILQKEQKSTVLVLPNPPAK